MKKGITNLIYFTGILLIFTGALAKIQDWSYSGVLLFSGVCLYAIGAMIKQKIIGTRL
jgi:hypothetical protein